MKIKQFITENGTQFQIKDMAEEFRLGLMDQDMKDIGKTIRLILEEN